MKGAAKKTRTGIVVSSKMNKTIVVAVERRLRHSMYGKVVRKTPHFYAHDAKNECREGDMVRIMEVRPLSKLKRWRVVEIVKKAE
jgi:small subunit ribosomal protein S17